MCSICGQDHCHSRYSNYVTPKTIHYCSICGEGIYEGEEYIKNDCGEYRHYGCFYGLKELLGWLGYEIRAYKK